MKPAQWCHGPQCDKPRRYSGDDARCCACGYKFATRPKRGKPIKAIPAYVWMFFDGDGKQVGPAYLSRPGKTAIGHLYAGHVLGRSCSRHPQDDERARFAGWRLRRFHVRAKR